MGWPRKNEMFRLYFERKSKTYLLVCIPPVEEQRENTRFYSQGFEGVGELLQNNNPDNPMLCACSPSHEYLYKKCRRVSWDEMPDIWQKALSQWINGKPEDYRGLWRM